MKKFNDDLPDDPPPKKTGGTTNGSGGGTPQNPGYDWHRHYGSGYYDGNTPPSACKGRPC